MKIVVIDSMDLGKTAGPGSPALFSRNLIPYLRDKGHEVVVSAPDIKLCAKADVVWTEWCNEDAFEVAEWGVCKKLILRMRGYDVWSPLQKLNWRAVDRLVYESPLMEAMALEYHPWLAEKPTSVINGGVDMDVFTRSPHAHHGNVVAMSSRADTVKGFQLMMEWARQRPDLEIHVTTVLDDHSPRLTRYLERCSPPNFHVHGAQDDVPGWLNKIGANYLVCASIYETFSYSVAEAMAMGIKPLVHAFPGVERVWPPALAWTSLHDLNTMILPAAPYDADYYETYIRQHYNAEDGNKAFEALLSEPSEREPINAAMRADLVRNKLITLYDQETLDLNLIERITHDYRTFTKAAGVDVSDRALWAVRLAASLFNAGQYVAAETWALRALQGGVRADAMSLLAEIAWLADDVEAAHTWLNGAEEAPALDDAIDMPDPQTRRIQMDEELTIGTLDRNDSHTTDAHVFCMITCPREPETLNASLASFGNDKHDIAIINDSQLRGQAHNFFGALAWGVRTGAEWITIFEDDIEACRGLLDYIRRTPMDSWFDMWSWYSGSPLPFKSKTGTPCVADMSALRFSGAPAITISREFAEQILASDVVKNWKTPHGGDTVFGLVDPQVRVAIHYPSLVQHTGVASTTGNTSAGLRPAPTFVGADFDAKQLFDKW